MCVSLLLLLLPLQVKKVYGNFIVSDNVNTNSNEISVVIELNEMVNVDEFISFTDDLEYNQELIMKIRAQNKKNYKEKMIYFQKNI